MFPPTLWFLKVHVSLAGNKNYISIHGRLDKVVLYQNEMDVQSPFDANWNEIDLSLIC